MTTAPNTRERIVSAASKLFYAEGIRAVGVDAVAEAAGVTKRTLYYHFKSKDDLIAAYLEGRDQPNLKLFQKWFSEAEGGVASRVEGIFFNLARAARHPKWKGCGFLRTSAELASMPGHPAIRIGAAHKKKFEDWLRQAFGRKGSWRRKSSRGRSCCSSTAASPSFCSTVIRAIWRRRVRRRLARQAGAVGADNREGQMTVRRIVPNLQVSDPLQAHRFYADLLGRRW